MLQPDQHYSSTALFLFQRHTAADDAWNWSTQRGSGMPASTMQTVQEFLQGLVQ
jgi:hypothetical protein